MISTTIIVHSFWIGVLNILITHTLLTRNKSIMYCLVAFVLNTLFIYCAGSLVAINIQDIVIAKYVLYFLCFFYIVYIYLVFSETFPKKIFTMFSIWIFSLMIFFTSITVAELLSGIIDEKYLQDFIYTVRICLHIFLLLITYFWLSKPYKKVLGLVPDKTIYFISLYPITAFLLLINNYATSFAGFRNFTSIYDILLLLVFITLGYLIVFAGISASSKVELQRYTANYDHLTGIANRANIMNQLAKTIELSNKSKQKFALFMIDFDGFKKINDEYGHLIGDKVLKYAVQKVQKVLRKTDATGRLGGDEFVIIQQYIEDERDVETLINRIFKELQTPLIVDDKQIPINLSIGVSIFPDYTSDLEDLINQADCAMYEAKKRAGCTFAFFDI